MLKTETSSCTESTERSTSNGISFMLMTGQRSQRRENSTKTSVFMLTDHSTLSHHSNPEDILT